MPRGIITMPPVEAVSGKFARVEDTCSKSRYGTRRWIGGMVRRNSLINHMVIRVNPIKWHSTQTEEYAMANERAFGFVATEVALMMRTPDTRDAIINDFRDGKSVAGISSRGYAYANGWAFAVMREQYSNGVNDTSSPQYSKWPTADK